MKKLLCLLSIAVSFINIPAYSAGLTLFDTEYAAQSHCPSDVIVWLNLPTGVWHYKGARWYGNTNRGSFVCREEAQDAGNRASLNGS